MKKLHLIIILIALLFAFAGCQSTSDNDDSDTGTTTGDGTTPGDGDDTGGTDDTGTMESAEVTSIDLAGVDFAVIINNSSSAALNKSLSTTTESTHGFYVKKDGVMKPINIGGGAGKTVTAAYRVRDSVIKTVQLRDASGDTTTAFVRPDNSAVELPIVPVKSSNLGNADYFVEVGGKIYFRTPDNKLRTLTLPDATASRALSTTTGDVTADIASGVEQFAIHENGEMIIDTGTVVNYVTSDSTNDLDLNYPDTDRGINWNANATDNHFFMTSGNGFIVQRGGMDDDFIRYSTTGGSVTPRYSQQIAYYRYLDGENGVYYKKSTQKPLSSCKNLTTGNKQILICDDELYSIGDASTDLSRIDLSYSEHHAPGLQIAATENYLYMYSENSEVLSPRVISRENVFNQSSTELVPVFATIPRTIDYKVKPNTFKASSTDTSGDVLNFCAVRQSDNKDVIVEIINADTTHNTTVIESACDQLISY